MTEPMTAGTGEAAVEPAGQPLEGVVVLDLGQIYNAPVRDVADGAGAARR